MPRIICTVTNDLSHDQRMIRICSSLVGAGYEVWLVGREKPDSPTLPQRPFRQLRLKCRFHSGKLFYLEYNLRLFFFLLRNQCSVINSIDLDTLWPGFVVSRWRGVPCVYDAHEYFTETPEVVRRSFVQWIWERLASYIIPKLEYCYTVGPALALIFQERYGPLFSVIRNLPAQREIPEEKPLKQPIILYQGMLNEGRGLEVAIAAMKDLPEATLWLAGKGDVMDALQGLTEELGLQNRVKFLGFVSPDQLPELTEKAWLGLNLLENKGLSYYYSLANKAFDYIQAGLPSIQMDFPEYRSLQQEYGPFLLLEELTPSALASSIRPLLEEPARYEQLRENCIKAASQLHWETEEQELLDFYQCVLPPA